MSQDARTRTALELIGELSDPAVTEPGPGTPLAAIGIDSLAFAELALALEERLGLDLGRAELDAAATVGELLGAVEAAGPSRGAHEVPASVGRLQGVADVLAGGPLRWWLAARVTGAEHVPERGPAVLAMNHESALDIPLAVIASPRRITFMAKRELFENGFASWSLERLGGFRVDRSRFDLGAVRTALAVLARGDVLGMYPEGTRSPGRLLPFLDGAAWIALQAGVRSCRWPWTGSIAATWPGDPGAPGSASRSGRRSRSSASTIRVSVVVEPPSSHRSSAARSSATCARDASRVWPFSRGLTVGYPPRV
jgi:1-acyl-sn-glycerol-3-phosphate acyltransferase